MWIGKGLIVGVVACLVAGASVLAIQVASTSSSPNLDDSPMTVPVGRVGDQITYAVFERRSSDGGWERKADWGFEVGPVAEFVGESGWKAPVIPIVTTASRGSAYLGLVYPELASAGVDQVKNYKISLERRTYLARTFNYAAEPEPGLVGTVMHLGANTHYGSNACGVSKTGQYRDAEVGYFFEEPGGSPDAALQPTFLHVAYQGRTIRLGADIGDLAYTALCQETNNIALEGAIAVPRFEYSAGVIDRRLVGSFDSYNLRSEGCAEFRNVPGSWTAASDSGFENNVTFFHTPVPYEQEVCFRMDVWLSGESAYPVLTETEVRVGGALHFARRESLAASEPGSEAIPWQPTMPSLEDHTPFPDLERTHDTNFPMEGSNSRLAFGLSEALRIVRDSPALLRFSAWKTTHPTHHLVGYELTPREQGIFRWHLVYGSPEGSFFVLVVQKAPSVPAEPVREVGEFRSLAYGEERLRTDRLTLSGADHIWSSAVQRGDPGTAPNWIRWGYDYDPEVLRCTAPNECKQKPATVRAPLSESVLIGYTSDRGPAGTVETRGMTPIQGRNDTYAVVWTNDFGLRLSGHAQEFSDFRPLAGSTPATLGPVPAHAVSGDLPQVGKAALVATSLLALFLAAYFLPLLKEFGLQIALAMPGYAKLHKRELLNNRYRDGITSLVRSEPGITARELQTAVGGSLSTVVYHLRVLERNKLVSSLVDGRHKRFFPTEQVSWGERGRLAALRNAKTRELYELIHQEPGLAPTDLSRRVGLSRPTVYWHVDRLVRVGLVGHDRERGRARFYASDPAFRIPGRADHVGVEVA